MSYFIKITDQNTGIFFMFGFDTQEEAQVAFSTLNIKVELKDESENVLQSESLVVSK